MLHAVLLIMTLVIAQKPELLKGQFPEGWAVRVDAPADHASHGAAVPSASEIAFVSMPPGWHVTTGPAAILYKPGQRAAGRYTVSSETFLFDPGTRREGYGIFIGGKHLDGPDQSYTYFLIRRSGEFLIKRRSGATTVNVKEWTATSAIRKFDDRAATEKSVRNVLQVQVGPDSTTFLVNGTDVARVPTAAIDSDGNVGLRINHQLNLHVASLEIGR